MLRSKPSLTYCGLTIVLSNPSRFDTLKLLNSKAGELVNAHCLRPEFNVMQCDVRLADDNSPWHPGTRCIILLGEFAMHKYLPETKENVLNEMRGSPFYIDNIPAIASYFPQDCLDPRAHEKNLNKESKEYQQEDDGDDEEEGDVKRFSNTRRRNYAFWLRADFRKCKDLLSSGSDKWPVEPEPTYKIYPPAEEVIDVLRSTKGAYLDYDKETDYEEQNPLCFAFTFDSKTIYSVPILDNNYQWAYSSIHYILRALAIAIRDNVLVAHNGAAFDFLVLAYKLGIPIGKNVFDTMVAMHRCFPDVEVSLGHFTSLFTYQKFHKDNNPGAYFTREHMFNMLKYCGKDVFTMSIGRQKMMQYARTIPGLVESINCANRSIRGYTTTTLMGIPYDEEKRKARVTENDRLMNQYLRCIKLLIGENNLHEIQKNAVKGKKKGFFPSSNPQCVEYFHNMLEYPPVMYGKPSKIDGSRKPSLAKKAMYKLRLKYENPVIDFTNVYRYTKLEVTTPLGFTPWKDDSGKIVKTTSSSQTQEPSGFGTLSQGSLIPETD